MLSGAAVAAVLLGALSGCHGGGPEFRVLGVHADADAQQVVFVQVTNPADHPMKLTKLAYRFDASGQALAQGEVPLARDVPGSSTAVVEVPFDASIPRQKAVTLEGTLTAEQDDIVRTFRVEAKVAPRTD